MRAKRQRIGPVHGAAIGLWQASRAVALVCPSFVVLVFSVVLLPGCGREPANAGVAAAVPAATAPSATKSPLYCPPIDLGVVYPGEVREHRVWLENRSDEPIEIGKIETSCECVTARLEANLIAPRGRAVLVCRYDGKSEPDFHGSLAVAIGLTGDIGLASHQFKTDCLVEVVPSQIVSKDDLGRPSG